MNYFEPPVVVFLVAVDVLVDYSVATVYPCVCADVPYDPMLSNNIVFPAEIR